MHDIMRDFEDIKESIRSEYGLTFVSYQTWIEPLQIYEIVDDTVVILIPSEQSQILSYIASKYTTFFQVAIAERYDHAYEVKFVLKRDVEHKQKAEASMTPENSNVAAERGNLSPKYKYDTFVVGSSNNFAHSASLAVAESPGKIYNPLYLYGGPGLGKTHLMHSIGHFILEEDPNKKILYVTSEDFTNDVIDSIRSGSSVDMIKLREKYRSVDVLMVDDIQFIIGKDIINADEPQEINPEIIIGVVAEHFSVKRELLVSSSRLGELVLPRHVAMYLCRELTGVSYSKIGKSLGNKDHSTVMNGIRRVRAEVKTDGEIKKQIEIIKKKLKV